MRQHQPRPGTMASTVPPPTPAALGTAGVLLACGAAVGHWCCAAAAAATTAAEHGSPPSPALLPPEPAARRNKNQRRLFRRAAGGETTVLCAGSTPQYSAALGRVLGKQGREEEQQQRVLQVGVGDGSTSAQLRRLCADVVSVDVERKVASPVPYTMPARRCGHPLVVVMVGDLVRWVGLGCSQAVHVAGPSVGPGGTAGTSDRSQVTMFGGGGDSDDDNDEWGAGWRSGARDPVPL